MSKPVRRGLPVKIRRRCCAEGRHAPGELRYRDERGVLQTRCRLCGAKMVQIFTRSWFVSGELG